MIFSLSNYKFKTNYLNEKKKTNKQTKNINKHKYFGNVQHEIGFTSKCFTDLNMSKHVDSGIQFYHKQNKEKL